MPRGTNIENSRDALCPRRKTRALSTLLLAAVGLSCGTSTPIGPDAGGAGGSTGGGTDAPVTADRPATGAGGRAGTADAGIGTTCALGSECASGQCFDGVCCDRDCSGACQSCALPGTVGTCVLADVGTDPRNDCPDQGVATCGTDGACDGSGGCRKYPTGVVCKPPSCSGSTQTLAFRCAGGACAPTSGQPCDPYMCSSTSASCPTICAKDADCLAPNSCVNGSCGKRPLGGACDDDTQCNSGMCQQKVCCSSMCAGTCQSCALPGSEGACTNVPERQDPLDQCADQGAASCGTDGACNGAGACRFYARGTTCRAAAGICDVAETCAGTGAPCPDDVFQTGTTCRNSVGPCDVAETCSGTSAACPPDALAPALTVCRQISGPCDSPETCSGTSTVCPSDSFLPASTVCRGSNGACDIAENCTGSGVACPADRFLAANTSCRGAAGLCDAPEVCTGQSAACPPDLLQPANTSCRGVAGDCDVAERCTGSSVDCPADGFLSATSVCRSAAGPCDIAENCSGTGAACPADRFIVAGMMCRQAAGDCDAPEACTGTGAVCPIDLFITGGTCRGKADVCDVEETCSGSSPACPADRFVTTGTPCRAAVDLCDAVEACTGASAACPADAMLGTTSVCRPALGACDVPESCTGSSNACPGDALVAAGVSCRPVAGLCDIAESCNGTSPACPADGFVLAGMSCRPAAGGCDVAEACDGATGACPFDAVAPAPAAPVNLAATRGNAQTTLTWTAVAGTTTYVVKRSTVSGGPYATVGTTAATTFTSTGLTNGTTFFFVVSATTVSATCESPNSAQVAIIPSVCPGVYCDDFEADTVNTVANGWTRVGGSDGDFAVVADGSKFFAQRGAVSSTLRAAFSSGAPGAPWSGNISVSADVKITALGLSAQAAMVCARFVDLSNYYCLAVTPTGVQIQTRVGGSATNSAIFAQSITTGSIHQVKLSLSGNVLSATLDSSVRGTLTPAALGNGFAAVATQSIEAEFDNVVVTQP